ncbi:MAG: glycosyltransferase family 4 protein [Opitutae bacterium]|nr:glycosyltransferase family 4 protein [Opitutae bacterium]
MKKKTVVLVTHEYPPKRGGAGTYCEELVYACEQLSIPMEVWVPEYARKLTSEKFRVLPVKGTQGWVCSMKSIRAIAKKLKTDSDRVTLHLAEPGSLRAFVRFGWLLRKMPDSIVTIHGTELLRFCSNPLEKFLFRRLLKKSRRIHVLSNYNKTALLNLVPEVENRVLLFPGAPARRLMGKGKNKSLGKDEKLKILCVGRIHPRKGQDRLLEAVSNLPEKLAGKIQCLLVGPVVKRKFYDKLKKFSGNLNCQVSFLGDLHDGELETVYREADVFVMPSMPREKSVEGFGFVYLEAASHGLPVVAHETGGVKDAVQHGKNGFLVNPDEPDSLAECIGKLIEDEDLRKEMGEQGLKWASSHSWDEVAMQLYSGI